jgi:predicted RNA-binding protein (virulence factor B family)
LQRLPGKHLIALTMAEIGKYNQLEIVEQSNHGLYLDGGEHGTILIPHAYVTAEMLIGQTIKVFVYKDSEDRLVATTETPFAQVGEFAYLEVVGHKANVGFFLDWGLGKHLLLPYREKGNMELMIGDGVVVAIYLDEKSQRIVASTRLHRFESSHPPDYEPNQAVSVIIYGESPLGYKAIVDGKYRGLLYYSETSDKLEEGDRFTGYVKKIRSGGKIDLRRDPAGYGRVEGLAGTILEKLEAAGGTLPFNDKTSPEDIRETFNTSKKAFKQALGALYKQRRIRLTKTGIESASD